MQMIADGKINKNQDLKIIFNDNSVESFKFDGDDILDGTYRNIFDIYGTKVTLKQDFEILEDKTEEIEEIKGWNTFSYEEETDLQKEEINYTLNTFGNKLNELVRAVNKLNKQDTSKETNCMSE